MTGTTIGQYQVLDKLGEGGMGVVYKARDARLGRFVALKLLPPGTGDRRESRERFLNEARTASSLGHPNIVTIHDIVEHDGTDCLVMEFIPGQTLEQLLKDGPLRQRQAIDYAVQVADALAAAHRAGLIHRDLKPGNIMITPDGLVKVVDFGLAKLAAGADSSEDLAATRKALTARGAILGTAAYMSPEQAEGKTLDARTDIFSFGAVLYEMLTGKRAFPGDSAASTLAAVLKEEPAPLPQAAPGLSPNLDLIVRSCLRKDPNKRLQHLADIKLLFEMEAAPAAGPAAPPAPKKPVALVAATALLTLAAGLTAGYLKWGRPASSPDAASAQPIRLSRLTSGRPAFAPALSPDGNLVVYAKTGLSQAPAGIFATRATEIYLQPVRGGAEVQLTSQGSVALRPRFSADGSRVYYNSLGPPRGIFEVPLTGGEPRLLVPEASGVAPSPDGKWLAYHLRDSLHIRPVDGGPERKLLDRTGMIIQWSPDSTRLLVGHKPGNARYDLVIVPITGGDPILTGLISNLQNRNLAVANITEWVAWLPKDDLVFCGPMGAAANLFRIPISQLKDGTPVPLTNGVGGNCQAAIGRDRLVFANQQLTNGIWSLPVNLNEGKVTGALKRVTPEGLEAQFPDVRPDNAALVYIGRTGEGQGAYFMDLQRGVTRQLALQGRSSFAYTTFSPDATRVAFGQGGADWPTFAVPAAGGEPVSLGGSHGRIRGWSPDGRYLLIWRQRERSSVGVLDLQTKQAAETLASAKLELVAPRLSPDARWVTFSAAPTVTDSLDLYSAPFRGSQPVPESEWRLLVKNAGNPFWSPDRRWLYFLQSTDGVNRLMRLPIDQQHQPTGPPTEFYRLDGRSVSGLLLNTMTASRDHLYLVLLDGPSDIWTMDLPRPAAK